MKTLFRKPHYFFIVASLIMAGIGLIIPQNALAYDINDTYYVISNTFGFHLFALIGFIMAYGYWTAYRRERALNYRLNVIHVVISALGPLGIYIASLFYREVLPPSENVVADWEHNTSVSMVIFSLALITLLVQIVYPVNLIRAIWKGKRKIKD